MAVCLVRSVFSKHLSACRVGIFGLARLQRLHTDDRTSNSSSDENHDFEAETGEKGNEAPPVEDTEEEEQIESKILRASLDYVPEYGWTSECISAGAETIGLSAMVKEMFPRAGGDLALFFIEDCNIQLADYLAANSRKELEDKNAPRRRATVVIQDAVEVRLRMIIPHIDTWSQVISLMARPQNAPDAIKSVSYLVDDIWYHAGDTSTDINWYTKRGVLAAIYGATELYMIRDRSEDFKDTWMFLDRRLEDVKQIAKMRANFQKAGTDTAQLLSAAITTGINLAGFNKRSR